MFKINLFLKPAFNNFNGSSSSGVECWIELKCWVVILLYVSHLNIVSSSGASISSSSSSSPRGNLPWHPILYLATIKLKCWLGIEEEEAGERLGKWKSRLLYNSWANSKQLSFHSCNENFDFNICEIWSQREATSCGTTAVLRAWWSYWCWWRCWGGRGFGGGGGFRTNERMKSAVSNPLN